MHLPRSLILLAFLALAATHGQATTVGRGAVSVEVCFEKSSAQIPPESKVALARAFPYINIGNKAESVSIYTVSDSNKLSLEEVENDKTTSANRARAIADFLSIRGNVSRELITTYRSSVPAPIVIQGVLLKDACAHAPEKTVAIVSYVTSCTYTVANSDCFRRLHCNTDGCSPPRRR